jgi:hypothetical protein
MSPGINYFLLLRDEQNSKCVGGGVLAVLHQKMRHGGGWLDGM